MFPAGLLTDAIGRSGERHELEMLRIRGDGVDVHGNAIRN